MGMQLLFLNTPIRIFHVVYGWALALLYCLNTYIAFKVDERRNRLINFSMIFNDIYVAKFTVGIRDRWKKIVKVSFRSPYAYGI